MKWKIKYLKKPTLNKPILIEGLPGIGNVGKVALDFIIEEVKAKKIAEFQGNSLPHSVFINEQNLIELPSIELYHKKIKNRDILLLAGDAQPNDEASCYEFCDAVLDTVQEFDCQEIITLGGIALKQEPTKPKVYVTGNQKKIVKAYTKGTKVHTKLYGKVGPIIGVSGLLPGLAKRRKINAVSLLAETFGHPLYLGVSGAREILKVLKKKIGVNVDIELLDKEIAQLEQELGKQTQEITASHKARLKKLKEENDYIG